MASGKGHDGISGGYDSDFVDAVPKDLECPVCLQALRDPMILSCCGAKMCSGCIGPVKLANHPCPLCQDAVFDTMLEKALRRRVLDLLVRCPKNVEGCQWVGELRCLEKHISLSEGDCQFVDVQCRYDCGGWFQRKCLQEHELSHCSKRPIEVQMLRIQEKYNLELEQLKVNQEDMGTKLQTLHEQVQKMVLLYEQQEQQTKNDVARSMEERKQMQEKHELELQELRTIVAEQAKELSLLREVKSELRKMVYDQVLKVFEQHKQQKEEVISSLTEKQHQIEALSTKLEKRDQDFLVLKNTIEEQGKMLAQQLQHKAKAPSGQSFTGFSPEVLHLMPKLPNGNIAGVQYFPDEGRVCITCASKEEEDACITQFQLVYRNIVQSRQLKTITIEVPSTFSEENLQPLLEKFNDRYNQCHFQADVGNKNIRVISTSPQQFNQAKKFLVNSLHGNLPTTQSSVLLAPSKFTKTLSSYQTPSVTTTPTSAALILPHGMSTPATISSASAHDKKPSFPTVVSSGTAIAEGPSKSRGNTSPAASEKNACPICMEEKPVNPVKMPCCQQVLCKNCHDKAFNASPYCAICRKPQRAVVGNQPLGGTMSHTVSKFHSLPGYEGYGIIAITYVIPDGIQRRDHPNPGKRYHGTTRIAYLPDTIKGREVLHLLRRAFDARLIFTIGTSHTSGLSDVVTWNDIHHKTSTSGGAFGYPDPTYLARVKQELKDKGIS